MALNQFICCAPILITSRTRYPVARAGSSGNHSTDRKPLRGRAHGMCGSVARQPLLQIGNPYAVRCVECGAPIVSSVEPVFPVARIRRVLIILQIGNALRVMGTAAPNAQCLIPTPIKPLLKLIHLLSAHNNLRLPFDVGCDLEPAV